MSQSIPCSKEVQLIKHWVSCPCLLILCLGIFLSYPLPLPFAYVIIPPSFSTSHIQQEEGHSVYSHIHPQTQSTSVCAHLATNCSLYCPVFSLSWPPFLSLSMPWLSSPCSIRILNMHNVGCLALCLHPPATWCKVCWQQSLLPFPWPGTMPGT